MKYLWMFLTILSAAALGKRIIFWALMSYLFSWAALIACIAIPANQKRLEERQRKIEDWSKEQVEQGIVHKEFKNINTVDDLFKQLETK
jgi:hypothetical protein